MSILSSTWGVLESLEGSEFEQSVCDTVSEWSGTSGAEEGDGFHACEGIHWID